MKFTRPIYWRQGIFLQPQHFQYDELYRKSLYGRVLEFARPSSFGFARLVISEERLKAGYLSCSELEAIMPSGQWVSVGNNAKLSDLDIRALTETEAAIPVAIGLLKHVPGSPAVANQHWDGRYLAPDHPETLSDIYDEGPEAEVERLWFNLRYLVGDEINSTENMEVLLMARLVSAGGKLAVAEDFSPHCLRSDSYPVLEKSISNVMDLLETRALRLAEIARPWRLNGDALDSGWLRDRMIHTELAHTITAMTHRIRTCATLEAIYEPLLVLSARISSLAGISSPDLPLWEANDPCRCFNRMAFILGGLLEQLRSGPDSIATFKPAAGWLEAQIPSSARVGQHVVYLVIKDASESQMRVASTPKLASINRIETIVSRALPGLELERLLKPPYGITNAQDAVVWLVSTQSALWEEGQTGGSVCMHWPEMPKGSSASLVFFRQ